MARQASRGRAGQQRQQEPTGEEDTERGEVMHDTHLTPLSNVLCWLYFSAYAVAGVYLCWRMVRRELRSQSGQGFTIVTKDEHGSS